ncbi:MAG: hypothetical protein MI864_04790 [Pseudomonadales bacterium]|nr:hypothetical protein [Pseudomonadales bacterium]
MSRNLPGGIRLGQAQAILAVMIHVAVACVFRGTNMSLFTSKKSIESVTYNKNPYSALYLGTCFSGMLLALPVLANDTNIDAEVRVSGEAGAEKVVVIVDGVEVEFGVNRSTLETFSLPQLDEFGLAGAYLPGAFEPTAAGEVEVVESTTQNLSTDTTTQLSSSEIDEQNNRRAEDREKVAQVKDERVVRADGNVVSVTSLVVSSR